MKDSEMKLYYELDLPNLIRPEADQILNVRKDKFKTVNPSSILSDDLLGVFKEVNLIPYFVIVFQHPMLKSNYENRILHRDITLTSDNPITWESLSTGINFELTDGYNEFSWFDIGNNVEVFPPDEQIQIKMCRQISAVECNHLNHRGIPQGSKLLDKIVVRKKPILVRTDIHHITSFEFPELRNGISIRFREENYGRNFQNAVDKLSNYIRT